MSTIRRWFFLFLLMLVLGGVIFLATWETPPPTRDYEFEIPSDQLPQ
ncbi:MAG: hypothetical protein KDH19_14660 [Geminicoccaceae bacterium]|nr:hypothetical protein [Geminicoccaceae bacterium]MCB2009363.1 hypothetical protein [Geminicoccaceae bacterium]